MHTLRENVVESTKNFVYLNNITYYRYTDIISRVWPYV